MAEAYTEGTSIVLDMAGYASSFAQSAWNAFLLGQDLADEDRFGMVC